MCYCKVCLTIVVHSSVEIDEGLIHSNVTAKFLARPLEGTIHDFRVAIYDIRRRTCRYPYDANSVLLMMEAKLWSHERDGSLHFEFVEETVNFHIPTSNFFCVPPSATLSLCSSDSLY